MPVYGVVPPFAVTVTVVLPPLQEIVPAVDEAPSTEGSLTVIEVTEEQPLASLTV